ncbi:MAG: rhomboid family intramembrane serine protease [Muribaculaceae bacterium]
MRFPPLPPVVKNLLILNCLIWLATALIPSVDDVFSRVLALHYFTSPDFNPAQLFTHMFMHAYLGHLFFNMFALAMFGGVIERSMGSRRFLFFYIACGLTAALVQMGAYAVAINHLTVELGLNSEQLAALTDSDFDLIAGLKTPDNQYTFQELYWLINGSMVGASGAIYGVLLAFGMLYPNAPVYIFFVPFPVKAKWLVIGYGVLELLQGLGGFADNVAHFAHLGGMIGGIILILWWKRQGVFRNGWFF